MRESQKINNTQADPMHIAIVGSGPVGLAFTRALASSQGSIALLHTEQQPITQTGPERAIALNAASWRMVNKLGVKAAGEPITTIRVTQQHDSAEVLLEAHHIKEKAFGYVVDQHLLRDALFTLCQQQKNLKILPAPNRYKALQSHGQSVELIGTKFSLETQLLVGAEGGHGGLAELAHLSSCDRDHNRFAVVASVLPTKPHNNMAHEHFLSTGPLALLPLDSQRYSLVWAVTPKEAAHLSALSDFAFLSELNRYLPPRFPGRLRDTGPRAVYPLQFKAWQGEDNTRLALLGNSAQTLHPVGGQGYNLGLRDAITLATFVTQALNQSQDPGSKDLLKAYNASRQTDRREIIGFTEGLNWLFGNTSIPLRLLRSLGLTLLNHNQTLKNQLAMRASGLSLPLASYTPSLIPDRFHESS